jgi:hypothetical protein
MIVADILPHVGRYCEVVTSHSRLFGEVVRLSAGLFLVRPSRPTAAEQQRVSASAIRKITDLMDPHL